MILESKFPSVIGELSKFNRRVKGRCNREKPPCKYLHPPQHLKEQLLVNGRNNLALKNAALMGQLATFSPFLPGHPLASQMTSNVASPLPPPLGPPLICGSPPPGSGPTHHLNTLNQFLTPLPGPGDYILTPDGTPIAYINYAHLQPPPHYNHIARRISLGGATHQHPPQPILIQHHHPQAQLQSPALTAHHTTCFTTGNGLVAYQNCLSINDTNGNVNNGMSLSNNPLNGMIIAHHAPLQQQLNRLDRVEICREYMRGNCKRAQTDCKFAHPSEHLPLENATNTVTVCMDALKGKCSRGDTCKYFHPGPPFHSSTNSMHSAIPSFPSSVRSSLHSSSCNSNSPSPLLNNNNNNRDCLEGNVEGKESEIPEDADRPAAEKNNPTQGDAGQANSANVNHLDNVDDEVYRVDEAKLGSGSNENKEPDQAKKSEGIAKEAINGCDTTLDKSSFDLTNPTSISKIVDTRSSTEKTIFTDPNTEDGCNNYVECDKNLFLNGILPHESQNGEICPISSTVLVDATSTLHHNNATGKSRLSLNSATTFVPPCASLAKSSAILPRVVKKRGRQEANILYETREPFISLQPFQPPSPNKRMNSNKLLHAPATSFADLNPASYYICPLNQRPSHIPPSLMINNSMSSMSGENGNGFPCYYYCDASGVLTPVNAKPEIYLGRPAAANLIASASNYLAFQPAQPKRPTLPTLQHYQSPIPVSPPAQIFYASPAQLSTNSQHGQIDPCHNHIQAHTNQSHHLHHQFATQYIHHPGAIQFQPHFIPVAFAGPGGVNDLTTKIYLACVCGFFKKNLKTYNQNAHT
ncbi:unnamed protein product [Gordionus sp. m RMFG-2023]